MLLTRRPWTIGTIIAVPSMGIGVIHLGSFVDAYECGGVYKILTDLGGLIGAVVTLLAAWLAWESVKSQIEASEKRAEAEVQRALSLVRTYAEARRSAFFGLKFAASSEVCSNTLRADELLDTGELRGQILKLIDRLNEVRSISDNDIERACLIIPINILVGLRSAQGLIADLKVKSAAGGVDVLHLSSLACKIDVEIESLIRRIEEWYLE